MRQGFPNNLHETVSYVACLVVVGGGVLVISNSIPVTAIGIVVTAVALPRLFKWLHYGR